MTTISHDAITLPHGTTLHTRHTGNGPARVVLLHGFPEGAFAWDEVMQALAPAARCWAPDQRGYGRSSAPAEVGAYRAKHLVQDLAALIGHVGAPLDLLVAHDWGGAVAWNLAVQHPGLLKQLLIINSPHPGTFLRELQHNPLQQEASQYMNFLCRPDAARLLADNGHERLWQFFTHMGPAPWLDAAMRARYEAHWALGLQGGLNWYAASPMRPATRPEDPIHTLALPDEALTVRVPTTVLWGERDTALLPGLLTGLQRWVPQLQVQRVPEATHWLVHEQPQRVVAVIQALLQGRPMNSASPAEPRGA